MTTGRSRIFRSGVVALAGKPNVGKSSLLNALLDYKLAIVSEKPQTTRTSIRGVLNRRGLQVIFCDTPGLHLPKHALGRAIVSNAEIALAACDVICLVTDATDTSLGPEDREVVAKVLKAGRPVLLVVNKTDLMNGETAAVRLASLYRDAGITGGGVSVSAKRKTKLDALIDAIACRLGESSPIYDEDVLTDKPERFLASEMIREKVLKLTEDEVPHSVAVDIEDYKSPDEYPERDVLYIRAALLVERPGQKGILLGEKGNRIREIGRQARKDIESMTGHKVYLELWVKVRPKWRQSEEAVRRLGLKE